MSDVDSNDQSISSALQRLAPTVTKTHSKRLQKQKTPTVSSRRKWLTSRIPDQSSNLITRSRRVAAKASLKSIQVLSAGEKNTQARKIISKRQKEQKGRKNLNYQDKDIKTQNGGRRQKHNGSALGQEVNNSAERLFGTPTINVVDKSQTEAQTLNKFYIECFQARICDYLAGYYSGTRGQVIWDTATVD